MTVPRALSVLALVTALVVSAAPQAAAARVIGVASRGETAFEFIARVEQSGNLFSFTGYLTHVEGLPDASLFSDPSTRSEATARITVAGTTTLTARSTIANLFVIDSAGMMRLYLQRQPGASFDDPDSFTSAARIAALSLRFHNVLNVQAPNQGISIGSGQLRQLSWRGFSLGAKRYRFGHVGLRERLFATGQGTRLEPTLPRSTLAVAGDAVVTGHGRG